MVKYPGMKTKSPQAPKRISRRPRLSRDDAKLKISEFPRSPDISFTPVSCGKVKGVSKYRLKLKGDRDRIVDLCNLKERFEFEGLRMTVVENVLNTIFDIVPRYIAETGDSVRIGDLVMLKSYAKGSIDNVNAEADPKRNYVVIRATELPSLRYRLKNARLVNSNGRPRGIKTVVGGLNPEEGIVDTIHDIKVIGFDCSEIYVPMDASGDAEVGVWLETLEGRRIVRCNVTSAGLHDLTVRIPPADNPIAPGEYRIAVVTRGSKDAAKNAPLFTYRRRVKVIDDR